VDSIDDAFPTLGLLEIEETGNSGDTIAQEIQSLLHGKLVENCENSSRKSLKSLHLA
jgi:hypothetical protein